MPVSGVTPLDVAVQVDPNVLHDIIYDAVHTIKNVPDPTNPQDVATKHYVDTHAASGAVIFVAHKQSANADTFEDFLGLDPTVNHWVLVAKYDGNIASNMVLLPNSQAPAGDQYSLIKRCYVQEGNFANIGEDLHAALNIMTAYQTGNGPGHSTTHLVRQPGSSPWTMVTEMSLEGAGFLTSAYISSIWQSQADMTSIRVQRADSAAFGTTGINWYLYKVLES